MIDLLPLIHQILWAAYFVLIIICGAKEIVVAKHTHTAFKAVRHRPHLDKFFTRAHAKHAIRLSNLISPLKWTFKATYPDLYKELKKHGTRPNRTDDTYKP